jgi:hypothetical protein
MKICAPFKINMPFLLCSLIPLLVLINCKTKDISVLIKDDEKNFAERILALFNNGQTDSLYALLDNQLKTSQTYETIGKLKCLLPNTPLQSRQFLKFSRFVSKSYSQTALRIQDNYSSNSALYEISFKKAGDTLTIQNFRLNLVSPENRISLKVLLKTLTPVRFAFGFLMMTIPLFIIATLILLLFSKGIKKKWLWFIFMFLGFVQFKLNWFAGSMNTNLLSFQFLGAGFFSEGDYGPLWISFSLPLGSIIFLIKRKSLISGTKQIIKTEDKVTEEGAQKS